MRLASTRPRTWRGDPSGPHTPRGIIDHAIITGTLIGIVGGTSQLTATAYDLHNVVILGVPAAWRSLQPSIATVNAVTGLVTFTGTGDAVIIATVDGRDYTTTVSTNPKNPTELMTLVNALGGGTIGGTMVGLYVVGVNQTVVADGASPTGFYCTAWDDAVNPGQGLHFRPIAATGAPCLADGTITRKNLRIPASVSGPFTIATRRDPGDDVAQFAVPNSGGLYSVLADRGAGLTHGIVAAWGVAEGNLTIGGGTSGELKFDNTQFEGFTAMDDQGISSSSGATPGTVLVHLTGYDVFNANDINGTIGRMVYMGVGRDLHQWFPGYISSSFDNTVAAARDIDLLPDGGLTTNHPLKVFYVMQGRPNRSQRRALSDYFATKYTMWEDNRRLAILFGDSFQAGMSVADLQGIMQGSDGASAVSNACIQLLARSGANWFDRLWMNFYPCVADADFSRRVPSGVACVGAEYLNGATLAQNEFWMDQCRASDPKIRVVPNNILANAFSNFANIANWNATLLADPPTHGDAIVDFVSGLPWSTFNWGDGHDSGEGGHGYPIGQNPIFWGSFHPTVMTNRYWRRFYAAQLRVAFGDADTTLTMRVDPSVDHVTLTSGAPTANPGLTAKNRVGTTLGGKTYTHAMKFADGTSATAVATVAADGTITRVAVGHCCRESIANDGGICVVDVNCT